MELRVLNYFLMVASEENISKAARRLHLSQPALSRQIMALERELGVKLFKRSSHNATLTEEGNLLKRRAEEIIALAEKTKNDLACSPENLKGEIAIGCAEALSVKLLSKMLATFKRSWPRIQVALNTENADIIKERLEKGLLELGLLVEPVDIGQYESVRLPVQEQWGVLVPSDSALGAKESVTPSDLESEPLLLARRSLVRDALAAWFGPIYERLNVAGTYNLLYNAAIMAQNNLGVALGLKLDAKYEGLCFKPLFPLLTTGTVLVWKKTQKHSPVTASFLAHAKTYLQSISGYTN